ncbi:SDR family oxidoreductase [Roseobacter sp. EG26]|uniref:SDR family oxidoreductase n=1 Tax=Roseobacter sp. EG26 TaxID=3412477 RepID=UPI003CE524FC
MKTNSVLVAGATGYLGRHIVKQYMSMGWNVRALVRKSEAARASGLIATELFEGEATNPSTLCGAMDGVDLVISALGITRQRDGLTYWDVDYQANANLLADALAANVERFAYVHVLNAHKMQNVPLVAAKQAFVDRLQAAPIQSTVIAPSGFFSDMGDFLNMAAAGRVYLFGSGHLKLNPIDGADLAEAIAGAIRDERDYVPVGGPEVLTQDELAEVAFEAIGKPAKIVHLPDVLRRATLKILPFVTPSTAHGPALFFLSALGMNMVGEAYGQKRVSDHFAELRTPTSERAVSDSMTSPAADSLS